MLTRMYIMVNLALSESATSVEEYSSEDSFVDPEVPDGHELVILAEEDLGGLSFEEFVSSKKPIVTEGAVSGWEDRHSGLSMSISATPKNDGSNTPTISMESGLADSPYIAGSSPGIALNSDASGTLDGLGEGSFKVKVTDGSIKSGSVTVAPDGHRDFVPVTFEFDVDPGVF